ncbi:MAG TPA: hypothetical protein VN696_00145 [Pyrinomonadaceae bacterium]|nr:hypothetical protein [Pyrinomonadaceae bacterium]
MFRAIWRFANQIENDSEKEQAKLLVLKYLFPQNPRLARQFLNDQPDTANTSKGSKAARESKSRLDARLASDLIDVDPSMAAAVVEQALITNPNPGAVSALVHLRDKDSFLSDYVAAKVLDGLPGRPTLTSLATLELFAAYMFPGPGVSISFEAESSLQSLQFRYLLTGSEVLRKSLTETNEALKSLHYTELDLQFRAANQGMVATILAALASRIQPSLAPELNAIAVKLSAGVPPNIAQMTKIALARISGNQLAADNPEESFALALSSGNFDKAREALDKVTDEKKKDIYGQLLIRNEAKAFLAKSDFMSALTNIRNLTDTTIRLAMYLEALKAIRTKKDPEMMKILIDEARLLIPQTDRNGLQVRALLSFAAALTTTDAKADAADLLGTAVTSINGMEKRKGESAGQSMSEAAMAELNDPASLLDSSEMEQAFASVGLLDFDQGLAEAKRIEIRSVRLVARLEVLQATAKRIPIESKPRTPSKVSSIP